MWKYPVAEDVLPSSVGIQVHVSSVARWVTGLGELLLFDFFTSHGLIWTFQRMPQSRRTVSHMRPFCHVPLTLSYLALLDATALLVTVL